MIDWQVVARVRAQRIAELERAIQRALDDEESRPGGWGPDVTCVSILREAMNPQRTEP